MFLVYKTSSLTLKNIIVFIFTITIFSSFSIPHVYGSNDNFTEISSDITEDTVWSLSHSPYIISNAINIVSGVTLTIESGVVVKFIYTDNFFKNSINVSGKIVVNGEENNKVYFTSNFDDELGGSTDGDDYEICDEEMDIDGNPTGVEICAFYDSGDPQAGDWGGLSFDNSKDSVFKNTVFKYADRDTLVLYKSNVDLENINIENSIGGMVIYEDSHVKFTGGNIKNINEDAVVVFNNSSFNVKDLTITDISGMYNDPIAIFNDSSFTGENLRIENIVFERTDVIILFNNSDLSLKDSYFKDCPYEACITFFDGREYLENPSSVYIENTVFDGGLGSGLLTFGKSEIDVIVKNSLFKNFTYYAIENYSDYTINAENNYWDDTTGPYHELFNISGLGEAIYGEVSFSPWLLKWPAEEVCIENCFSNVLFFPGMMASRLYEKSEGGTTYCGFGLVGEDCFYDKELWFSRDDELHQKLGLDVLGKTSNNDVYTINDTKKLETDVDEYGLVDEIELLGGAINPNIYKSFMADLSNLKNDGTIKDYDFIPYDWRLSLEDIITNGHTGENSKLSYESNGQDFSESFILKKLEELQKSSKSGKVTIVAHSNGGLVTKALIQKLKDTGNPLYDKIDKVILVAVPQVGTPEAFISILHGLDIVKGFVMDTERARSLAENFPVIYNLLPSDGYFTMSQIPFKPEELVSFPNSPLFDKQVEKYGEAIENKTELKGYILGEEGREKPDFKDTKHANLGNSALYTQAEEMHTILDNWQPSTNTKVIQIAGWGEETIAGIDYVIKHKNISYKPRFVVDGDATVVTPSALWMVEAEHVERWWVDLKRHNTGLKIDREHKDILEIEKLRDFIKNKIKDLDYSDSTKIITNNQSSLKFENTDSRLHFTLHSPLYLGVSDEEGLYTGIDPITGEIKEEIPNVSYLRIGDVQFISLPSGISFTLKLQGYEEGLFSLDVERQVGNEITEMLNLEDIFSFTNTRAIINIASDFKVSDTKLQVDEDGDGDIDIVYPKARKPIESTPSVVAIINNSNISSGIVLGAFTPIQTQSIDHTINSEIVLATEKDIEEAQDVSEAKVAVTDT